MAPGLQVAVSGPVLSPQATILVSMDCGAAADPRHATPESVVATALVLLVRPLSVLLSVWPKQLPWRERLVLAMTAPRGIVAAAVASLAAHEMGGHL